MTDLSDTSLPAVVVVNDTRTARHYGCQAVMEAIMQMVATAGGRIIHFHSARPWADNAEFHEQVRRASLVLVNGEGTIHHSKQVAHDLAGIAPFCRQTLGIPSVLLNATLHANNAEVYGAVRQFDYVQLRDSASIAEATENGVVDPVYCPDYSLFHDFSEVRAGHPAAGSELKVGYTDSILPKASLALQEFTKDKGYKSCNIHFRVDKVPRIETYAKTIAGNDLLVTGRYHAACYAVNTRTPFIAVESNTPKITSLLLDVFGSARRVIDPAGLNTVDLREFATWTPEEMASLDRFALTRRQQFGAVTEKLKTMLQGAMVPS